MDIDLTRLRHIVAIARRRSFSRAAEELNITQPALSRSIASFEQRFDLKLFDRSRAGVVPTALGTLAIAEAENVLRAARDLDLNLRLYAKGEAGKVSIGLGPLMGSMLLPSLGRHLMATRPGLQLRFSIRTVDQLLADLLEDEIELMVGNSWSISALAGLDISTIGSVEISLIARSGHPLASQSGLTLADLQCFPVASASALPVAGLAGAAGAIICDNFHILRELVLESDAIWISSTAFAARDIDEGEMTRLEPVDFEPIISTVSLVRRAGRTMSPAAVAITDHIEFLLAPAPLENPRGD